MATGEHRLARLIALLMETGRTGDLARAVSDAAYRDELYKEFSIA